MPNQMMQPYEHEDAFWPLSEWPLTRALLPAFRGGGLPLSGLSIWEEQDFVLVEAALPGIRPGEVELTVERGVLTIRAERKEEKEEKERKYFQKASSSFVYRLSVPGELDEVADPEASLANGVLRVRFKKHKRSMPRKIAVK